MLFQEIRSRRKLKLNGGKTFEDVQYGPTRFITLVVVNSSASVYENGILCSVQTSTQLNIQHPKRLGIPGQARKFFAVGTVVVILKFETEPDTQRFQEVRRFLEPSFADYLAAIKLDHMRHVFYRRHVTPPQ
jgi:hypothetical protein